MLVADLAKLYVASRSPVLVDQGVALRRAMRTVVRGWGERDADDIEQADFDRYAAEQLARGKMASTVRQQLSTLLAALHFGARCGHRRPVPLLRLPTAASPTYVELTEAEAERLLRFAPDTDTRCFIAIALMTGARVSAICELTWDRIDLEQGVLEFNKPHAKGHRQKGRAAVPITHHLVDFLKSYKALEPRERSDVVFWRGPKFFEKRVIEAGSLAGIERRVTPNLLRHTAAIRMIRAAPLIYASRALGHLSLSATAQVYRQTVAESLRPAATILNELLVLK